MIARHPVGAGRTNSFAAVVITQQVKSRLLSSPVHISHNPAKPITPPEARWNQWGIFFFPAVRSSRGPVLPPVPPLRTVRESFQSRLKLSNAPVNGDAVRHRPDVGAHLSPRYEVLVERGVVRIGLRRELLTQSGTVRPGRRRTGCPPRLVIRGEPPIP